ncbi:hypothetical protein D3C79_640080 [compost metagenome]
MAIVYHIKPLVTVSPLNSFGAYVLLLMNHREFNCRHFEHHAADINRHSQRIKVGQGMVEQAWWIRAGTWQ